MKKAISFSIILFILINGCIDKENIKEVYKPPVCGDNICELSEENYCLDCNLACKSELCNSKINVFCDKCTETQKELLPELFEYQNIAYNCLKDFLNYSPKRLIYYTVTKPKINNQPCLQKNGCYISGVGFAETTGVKQAIIPGLIRFNKTEVTEKQDIGIEIHEFAHVFTRYGLGITPTWFTEGISIYTESRIFCHPNYVLSEKLDSFLLQYEKLKKGNLTIDEIAPYDEYYKTEHNAHVTGSMFFIALENDYYCNKDCISEILYSLHEYKENCTGICFENAKKRYPELANTSLNNNDLRIPIITNRIIKEGSEEIIGRDLTSLFNLLKINYENT